VPPYYLHIILILYSYHDNVRVSKLVCSWKKFCALTDLLEYSLSDISEWLPKRKFAAFTGHEMVRSWSRFNALSRILTLTQTLTHSLTLRTLLAYFMFELSPKIIATYFMFVLSLKIIVSFFMFELSLKIIVTYFMFELSIKITITCFMFELSLTSCLNCHSK